MQWKLLGGILVLFKTLQSKERIWSQDLKMGSAHSLLGLQEVGHQVQAQDLPVDQQDLALPQVEVEEEDLQDPLVDQLVLEQDQVEVEVEEVVIQDIEVVPDIEDQQVHQEVAGLQEQAEIPAVINQDIHNIEVVVGQLEERTQQEMVVQQQEQQQQQQKQKGNVRQQKKQQERKR